MRYKKLFGFGIVALGLGCASGVVEAPASVEASVTVEAPASVETPATIAPAAVDVEKLCAGRTPCEEVQRWAAGRDDAERPMQVLELALHDRGAKGHYPAYGDEECALFEYWLVRPAADVKPVLLLEVCNDGYGASGVGDDTFTVKDNLFTHARLGGSAWRWASERTVELSTLRVIEESSGSWWTLNRSEEGSTWDWLALAGSASWFVLPCDYDGPPQVMGEGTVYAHEPMVQIALDSGFRDGGWKTTALGSCSTNVNSQGSEAAGLDYGFGFVTHGEPGPPSEASFKAVMASPTELYVEVRDDAFIQEASSWVKADHLELWAGDDLPLGQVHCYEELARPVQWGITLDGEVHPASGRPKIHPQVERVLIMEGDRIEAVRFKIVLPRAYPSLSVVYSDTDDGKVQKRLIATSALKFNDPRTLGGRHIVPEDRGRCLVRSGALEYVPGGPIEPVEGKPVLN